ncbi:hypothetical protein [Pseudomonas sp. R5(2019)]|uniref:hypothetical protein n=1 Tax=Pseudomonas sp. R5(2019) TaxID=2697566 RepID=UPI0014136926|nr:hypothetical protein [Pseudomonas sp. R5(2019)]NBA94279.1 hypothetical protein [Pseudomonas sp. R5(2019)]
MDISPEIAGSASQPIAAVRRSGKPGSYIIAAEIACKVGQALFRRVIRLSRLDILHNHDLNCKVNETQFMHRALSM